MRGDLLETVLDDSAALGDSGKLRRLEARWRQRAAMMAQDGSLVTCHAWEEAADAALARAVAVESRLGGRVDSALSWERWSEAAVLRFRGGEP
jgi:hypothetical protein